MTEPTVHLKMTPACADLVGETLTCALYGGKWPEGGRASLLAVSDALHEALAPLTPTRNMAIVRDWPVGTNGQGSPSDTQALEGIDTQDE